MVTFHILTIFPDAFSSYFNESILKHAREKGIIKIKIYNIRDFAKDKHKKVDDKPYGGGPGMVMKIEPIMRTIKSFVNSKFEIRDSKFILLSPRGKQFTQSITRNYAKKYKNIILICGHYEGIDARLKKVLKIETGFLRIPKPGFEEISIGPYILSGGELGAMVIVDAVSRHIPGALGKIESLEEKKGSYPAYTRPEVFELKGKKYRVPKVLLSGDHKKISEWRKKYGKIV